ncbi:FIG000325: clustered with transcription termination protein NusA [hydrothermal vent metagenome]|uniref:FIG000325: clustered with transcription termination protein NusA n=1 Tax=hydrothermal vent metagenome TaxID=652676 RepID=A0A3B0UY08_9ZZZZ
MDPRTDRIKALISPIIDDLGLELVELALRNEQEGLTLRVLIYREEGVNIDLCARVSREISRLLEVEDPITSAYKLEVSSPGLTRPLTTSRDFMRNQGKKVKIKFAGRQGPLTSIGIIQNVDDEKVLLTVEGEELAVNLTDIHKAKLVIEF